MSLPPKSRRHRHPTQESTLDLFDKNSNDRCWFPQRRVSWAVNLEAISRGTNISEKAVRYYTIRARPEIESFAVKRLLKSSEV